MPVASSCGRAAIGAVLLACSSSSAPAVPATDAGQTQDGPAPADGSATLDAAPTVGEFTCSGHATIITTQPPGMPVQSYAIKSFVSTVITNADGTLTAYSGTDASGNCIFQYARPVGGVANLITPLTCPGPLLGTTATYTSGTTTVTGTSSSVTLDADLVGMDDGAVTQAKLVDTLTCVKK
jgi:hypothetical protein